MFKNLTKWDYKRTPLEALGFYIAYLIFLLIFIICFVIILVIFHAVIYKLFNPPLTSSFLTRITNPVSMILGLAAALILSSTLSFLIIKAKKLFSNFVALLLLLLSFIFTFLGGGILGLIATSILTMTNSKQTSEILEQE